MEAFTKSHGTLRNQLIDGLNDACIELLDDVLVEETTDGYAIYKPHYQKNYRLMLDNVKPKEATAMINSLLGGVVPKLGVQHITVGRSPEIAAFLQALTDVKNGHSMVKFWIGDFGSGKSSMLHLLNTVALKQKFVVANADFTPDNHLYANYGKAVALCSAIMDKIAIQTKPEGEALATLLEKWIEQVMSKTALDHDIPLTSISDKKHLPRVQAAIMASALFGGAQTTDGGSAQGNGRAIRKLVAQTWNGRGQIEMPAVANSQIRPPDTIVRTNSEGWLAAGAGAGRGPQAAQCVARQPYLTALVLP